MNQNRYAKIKEYLQQNDYPSYRYSQVTGAIFGEKVIGFEQMTALPKDLRTSLQKEFGNYPVVKAISTTHSPTSTKVLFELEDGEKVESVIMNYHNKTGGWDSLCISTQVGCAYGCTFCATGKIGFKRNLTVDEICDQVLYFVLKGKNVNTVSFMGMGEPLANPAIFEAISVLNDSQLFSLSERKINISTIGLVSQLEKLIKTYPQINIAFSLHSPIQIQREQLMPIATKYSIEQVFKTLNTHIYQNNRKVFIAYALLKGVNDSKEHAVALAKLIKRQGKKAYLYHVNLIEYHVTKNVEHTYLPALAQQVNEFKSELEKRHIAVTVRQSFGEEITAACGQLYAGYKQKNLPRVSVS